MAKLDRFFRMMPGNTASDLHLLAAAPPKFRIHGELEVINGEPPLTQECMSEMLFEILDDEQKQHYKEKRDLDFAYSLEGVARFRCNYFVQKMGYGAVFRIIPEKIKTISELNLPQAIEKVTKVHKGMVLVTGPTGSGKSTTLAAIIDEINSKYPKHILTIEDPIEFVHENKRGLVRQREVGADTMNFGVALRAALREDVDVVLVGEMRDLETIALAITLAETGVLVFGTLHTSSASKTIDRIIDVFPVEQQEQVRVMLSDSLRAVIAQQLLPTKDGKGRVAVLEILFGSAAVGNVIREAKTQQITSIIQGGGSEGMQTLDSAMMQLIEKDLIGAEEAYMRAQDKKTFESFLLKALMESALNGQMGRIEAMIKEGISPNSRDENQATPLMLAAQAGHANVVKLLLENSADINAVDNGGNSALIRAVHKDQTQIIRILIASGADTNAKNQAGQNALSTAVSNGSVVSVQALIDGKADVNFEDNLGVTPLIRATMATHADIVKVLIAAGANVELRDKSDRTALMYAVEKGHATIVDSLLKAGADVNAKTKNGNTPLMSAARVGSEVIMMLLQAGAEVNAQTQDGYTAMTFAAERGNLVAASALVKLGADVNVKTKNGVTPLMLACKTNPQIVRLLLAAGADIGTKNNAGTTALKYAQETGKAEVIEMLRQAGGKE